MRKTCVILLILFCAQQYSWLAWQYVFASDIVLSKIDNSTCRLSVANNMSIFVKSNQIHVRTSFDKPTIQNHCPFVSVVRNSGSVHLKGAKSGAQRVECKNKLCSTLISKDATSAHVDTRASKKSSPRAYDAAPSSSTESIAQLKAIKSKASKIRTIAIDAGHGGKDPGAIGQRHTKEKDITLKYAKLIAENLRKAGYTVVLTRDSDVFVPLGQRVQYAMLKNADIFLSIHADAAANKDAYGATIYILTPSATSKESLNAKAAKSIDGNFFANTADSDLNFNLMNLLYNANTKRSYLFAVTLVEKFAKHRVQTRPTPVRHAEFAVLEAPSFLSLLLEIGYISNSEDERRMNQSAHMGQISAAILETVRVLNEE